MERKIEIPLSPRGAQSIVEEVGAIVGQHINMMDLDGTIIASTDSSRLGTLHQGARRLLGEGLKELYIGKEEETDTCRQGLNLPVCREGSPVGVIGLTGSYEEVAGYGRIVKKMVEILIKEYTEQEKERKLRRLRIRLLEDWVLGNGEGSEKTLRERGFALGMDLSLPRRVMVASVDPSPEIPNGGQGSLDRNQELLQQAEERAACLAGPSALAFMNGGCQIYLVPAASDSRMKRLADHMVQEIEETFGVRLTVGIDGKGADVRLAYRQAVQSWHSARREKRAVMLYEGVTLELIAAQMPRQAKMDYIRKIFRSCDCLEICRWMEILQIYFEEEGALGEAAKSLHVHKNTLTYQLKKLESLTGYDVRKPSQSSVFYMALLFFREVKGDMEKNTIDCAAEQ